MASWASSTPLTFSRKARLSASHPTLHGLSAASNTPSWILGDLSLRMFCSLFATLIPTLTLSSWTVSHIITRRTRRHTTQRIKQWNAFSPIFGLSRLSFASRLLSILSVSSDSFLVRSATRSLLPYTVNHYGQQLTVAIGMLTSSQRTGTISLSAGSAATATSASSQYFYSWATMQSRTRLGLRRTEQDTRRQNDTLGVQSILHTSFASTLAALTACHFARYTSSSHTLQNTTSAGRYIGLLSCSVHLSAPG